MDCIIPNIPGGEYTNIFNNPVISKVFLPGN